MEPAFMNHLLSAAVVASRRAGVLIREVLRGGNLGMINKGVTEIDPQTEADRRSQLCIVGSLRKRWPELTIIGEESGLPDTDEFTIDLSNAAEPPLMHACPPQWLNVKPSEVRKSGSTLLCLNAACDTACLFFFKVVVWVDPLDGTREFTDGVYYCPNVHRSLTARSHSSPRLLPGFYENVTVLIGIAIGGKPVAGIIHQPFYAPEGETVPVGRSVWGLVGLGSFGFNPPVTRANGRVVATTRNHLSKEVEDAVSAISPASHLKIGGAGNKFIRLLEGNIDAYVYPRAGTCKWDTCAGEAVLRAVGGDLTDRYGNHYDYSAGVGRGNDEGIVATCGFHEYYMAHVRPLFPAPK